MIYVKYIRKFQDSSNRLYGYFRKIMGIKLASPRNRGTLDTYGNVVPRKGKSSMRDYSKMTDEEIKAIACRHYTDEELSSKLDRAKQQAKEEKCKILDKNTIDEIFERHAIYS